MSLPKEPRQKMINIMYLVLTALLALNVSVEILNAFKTVQNSLDKSSNSISTANNLLFEQLQAKYNDDKTKEQAAKYKPWADQAKALCEKEFAQLEWYKDTLLHASGLNFQKNGDSSYNESDIETPTRLFIENDNGKKLLKELTDLKQGLLNIDPEINQQFASKLPLDLSVPKSQSGNPKGGDTWEYSYFHMTPTVAAVTMLSKFQNDVKNAENQIVTYANSKIGAVKIIFNNFQPIATTSSNYVMPGDKFTITAGVGAFSDAAKPTISIAGQPTAINDKGVATRDMTADNSPGPKKVHVDIKYFDQNGKEQSAPVDIDYTVGQAAGASVSLDKLNVFYIGLDNPITIGSPTGMDRTSVTGKNCQVSLNGPHGTVKVTSPGECTITVAPQGSTPSTFTYKIKKIPEPEIKIGSGKARMPSVEVKNQTFCRADMGPDFIYDVHYSVVSATVYFSGAGFSNVVQANINGPSLEGLRANMQRCMPGSVITFDNVKVSGPDGVRIIEGKSFALY